MKIKNRHFLKSGEIKKLQQKLQQVYPDLGTLFSKNNRVETGILEDGTTIYLINGQLSFFTKDTYLVVFLRLLLQNLIALPEVIIDMGAVPYIARGADVMTPGIVTLSESIKKDDFVSVIDEKHHKPLAIGIALKPASDISQVKKGKAIKNLHYVGDKMWDFGINLGRK
ncbi:MAG: RNA-binding protein [Candidatus Helarchaeota archaeon]